MTTDFDPVTTCFVCEEDEEQAHFKGTPAEFKEYTIPLVKGPVSVCITCRGKAQEIAQLMLAIRTQEQKTSGPLCNCVQCLDSRAYSKL